MCAYQEEYVAGHLQESWVQGVIEGRSKTVERNRRTWLSSILSLLIYFNRQYRTVYTALPIPEVQNREK